MQLLMIEPAILANLKKHKVDRSPVSQCIPFMKLIGYQNGINISRARYWNASLRILKKSVMYN